VQKKISCNRILSGEYIYKMKKTLALLMLIMIVFSMASKDSMAAKKAKGGGSSISQEDMTSMSDTIDKLTKKVYANSLFSPSDNAQMIEIKIKLDNQMLIAPDVSLAPLYYKAAILYKAREYRQESIDCFQTILENFPDTALAPKARQSLSAMGVSVVEPQKQEGEEGQSTGQAADIENHIAENLDIITTSNKQENLEQ
jgi:hypothetical protein